MELFGVSGIPEPQKSQPTTNNRPTTSKAASIFDALNKKKDNVIDEQDGVDKYMLEALGKLVGNSKITLKNLTKAESKLQNFSYSKPVTQNGVTDQVLYDIQGKPIRTNNTKFDEKGNVISDKIEEFIYIKDKNGNDMKVKVNINKNACANRNAYNELMKQLVSQIDSLSDQAKIDLANEVSKINIIKTGWGNGTNGTYNYESDVITLYAKGGDGSMTGGVCSLPVMDKNTLAHEIGHAVDENNDESQVKDKINILDLRKAAYSKFDMSKYSDEQKYFLKDSQEFAAEYYAYKHGNPQDANYDLMRLMEKSGDAEFTKAAKACEQMWAKARQNITNTPQNELQFKKNMSLIKEHRLYGETFPFRREFYNVGEKLAPDDADEALTNTQVIEQYYLYRMGKCDEATSKKFESLKTSNDANWEKIEPIILKEFKRLGIEIT